MITTMGKHCAIVDSGAGIIDSGAGTVDSGAGIIDSGAGIYNSGAGIIDAFAKYSSVRVQPSVLLGSKPGARQMPVIL